MSAKNPKTIDWIRVIVHFILGILLGFIFGLFGITIAVRLFGILDDLYFGLIILGSTILTGIITAIFGDRFWLE